MSHTPIDRDHLAGIIGNLRSINSDAPELKETHTFLEFEERDMAQVIVIFIDYNFKIEEFDYKKHRCGKNSVVLTWPTQKVYITFI